MIIVTSGKPFIDIDAFACCVAYAELLQQQGKAALAVSSSVWNESIPAMIRDWDAPLKTSYTPQAGDQFVLVDLSDPAHADKIVQLDKVIQVIDHHPGQEAHWQHLGERLQTDFVGAAATLVYEHWQQAGFLNQMSELSARLMVSAILDNTLNFKAAITNRRDHQAYAALLKIANLPADWPAQYFEACQQAIIADPQKAMQNDSKILEFKGWDEPLHVGQLVVWDARELLGAPLSQLEQTLAAVATPWFLNLISIRDGHSTLVAGEARVQAWLAQLLGVNFTNNLARADRLWLRKEIIKQSLAA